MISKNVVVSNITNSYEHPFSEVVRVACQYQSRLMLNAGNKQVNAKSIMGIMAFNITEGLSVTITAEGEDEADALNAMEKLLVHC